MARTYPKQPARGGSRASQNKRAVKPPGKSVKKTRFALIKSRVLWFFGMFLLLSFVAGLCFAVGGYLGLAKSVNQLGVAENIETHPTYIYSAPLGENEGSRRVIGTIFQGENRKTTTLDQMPPDLLNALVAKEDERFREHAGVDVWGIMRALYVDVRAGEVVEGASTITQQYVRNAYLNQETTIKRKIKEALIAIQIETVRSKDEILADYLNTAYFGSNAYGVEAASETYFNKSVRDLSIAESATLVGLVWSPSTLGQDKAGAQAQRDLVIEQMYGAGYLTQQDYETALEESMPEEWPQAAMVESGLTGPQITRNFTEMVQDQLINEYGANTVLQGGLTVDTTLDLEAQQAAQDVIYGPAGYLASPDAPDAALISIDQQTGEIRAMVGNRDQSSQFNLATQSRRQPGSSFKPFAMIAALEQGIDPSTQFVSEDKTYRADQSLGLLETWKVKNFADAERGSISLEEALWESDNTVFTDLMMNVGGRGLANGPKAVADVATRLGLTADFGKGDPSIVLGTKEQSPLEMTQAYATIANDGTRLDVTAINRVVQNEGQESERVLKENTPDEGFQAIRPEIAQQLTSMMIGDVMWGIADDAALDNGQPVAGKTGTSESFFDSWFLGYTPELTTGIWMGYGEGGATLEDYLDPEGIYYGAYGSPEDIFSDYMTEAFGDDPVTQFGSGVEIPTGPEGQTAPTAEEESPGGGGGRNATDVSVSQTTPTYDPTTGELIQ
ncbi:transglycosylase domain-containing protein [Rubrobacter indicoceani]|uniref:transglycosylase domain-containing protein n=1 Tax=Rubrobacter indicoceani TaxID=2051957 RepID=UPI000E5BB87D|nr:transglycosylase domain-containing protein [Rubrobacter indicoceani]